MKKTWAKLLALVILIAVVAGVVFWRTILTYLAPKLVLCTALNETVSALDQRTQNSPLKLIGSAFDEDGRNTLSVSMLAENELLGNVECELELRTDTLRNQFLLCGSVSSQKTALDLSAYLNHDYVAFSSDSLLGGSYYGITYETFREDLLSIPMLEYVVTDELITQLEESLQSIRPDTPKENPQSLTLSEEELKMLQTGLLILKPTVQQQMLTVNNMERRCFRISFRITGQELSKALDAAGWQLPSVLSVLKEDPNGYLRAAFYLYKGAVVRVDLTAEAGEDILQFQLELGEDASRDDLTAVGDYRWDGREGDFSIRVSTEYDDAHYTEALSISRSAGEETVNTELSYDHTLSDGKTILRSGGETVELILSPKNDGFTMETQDFSSVLRILGRDTDAAISACKLTVSKGAHIQSPAYKNLDQWSLQDLLTLLNGVGSILGLEIE